MTYQTHATIPAYDTPKWVDGRLAAGCREVMKWGGLEKNGTQTPPLVGQSVYVTMNRLGPATVRGYFSEENWLGILVEFTDPPQWWIKQNGGDRSKLGHIFGPEFRIVE